ncbi:hypothetical protein I203_106378 [Kwoniella mangroviensis CBS 8507]|uniref:uncharacterized protein n=1 Tax=Kwoniella mangroviensis CBS 8507 TaxID=1296122 RepID=UPI00080CF72F|nr:uncharacterized protein I203_07655 [Kwoniella mangroviensis CBS 8507]OCF63231.1 hypothetical protein I203_07655 [Kwoniella mangroviensis CBS 8507]
MSQPTIIPLTPSSSSSSSSISKRKNISSATTSLGQESIEHTVQILHQICAHEHVFHEFFAVLDKLEKPPVRATEGLYYDRKGLFVDPRTGLLAKREDDMEVLQGMMKKITNYQRVLPENVIPEYWLDKIEHNFLSALSNVQIHLRSVPELDHQAGLFAKPIPPILSPTSTKTRKRKVPNYASGKHKGDISVSGIEFILISFPSEIDDPVDLGFNDQLMFEEWHGEKEITCIGLGMARVINHRCSENVCWRFPRDKMDFHTGLQDVGCLIGYFNRKKKLFVGEQLFAFYSKNFARNECRCQSRAYHPPGPDPLPTPPSSTRSNVSQVHTPSYTNPPTPTSLSSQSRCRKSTNQGTTVGDPATKKLYADPDDNEDLDALRSISPPVAKRLRTVLSPESDLADNNEDFFGQKTSIPTEAEVVLEQPTHVVSLVEGLGVKGSSWDTPIEVDFDDELLDGGTSLDVGLDDGTVDYGRLIVIMDDEGVEDEIKESDLAREEEDGSEMNGLESIDEDEWQAIVKRRLCNSTTHGFNDTRVSVYPLARKEEEEEEIQFVKIVSKNRNWTENAVGGSVIERETEDQFTGRSSRSKLDYTGS